MRNYFTQQGLRGWVDRLWHGSHFAWSSPEFGLFQSVIAKDNLTLLTVTLANMWLACLSWTLCTAEGLWSAIGFSGILLIQYVLK